MSLSKSNIVFYFNLNVNKIHIWEKVYSRKRKSKIQNSGKLK